MNEPKRRGRPPKAKVEALNVPLQSYGVVVPGKDALVAAYEQAQAYATRVWNGQNVELPRRVRLERVAKALEGQGMSMEGVEL